jgi:hypothetical protein
MVTTTNENKNTTETQTKRIMTTTTTIIITTITTIIRIRIKRTILKGLSHHKSFRSIMGSQRKGNQQRRPRQKSLEKDRCMDRNKENKAGRKIVTAR